MRRSLKVLLALVFLSICATGVHAAQTDCQRWWKEYREALAHTPAVHRIRHVRHRAHRAARIKLATLVHPRRHPAPKVLPARRRPRANRSEMLHALDFACGELPSTDDAELLDLTQPASFFADVDFPNQPVESLPVDSGPIALAEVPQYPGTTVNQPSGAPPIFGPPIGPVYGPGGLPVYPSTPGGPTSPTLPSNPNVPPVPESPVPEPGSIALVLTGALGAAGTMRRRMRSGQPTDR